MKKVIIAVIVVAALVGVAYYSGWIGKNAAQSASTDASGQGQGRGGQGGRGGLTAEFKYRYLKWKMNRLRRKFDVYSGGRSDWDRKVH